MGLFGWTRPKSKNSGKRFLDGRGGLGATKDEVRAKMMQMSDKTRGFGQHVMTRQEKSVMAQELFSGPGVGSYISRADVEKKISQLEKMLSYMKYHPEVRDKYQQSRLQDQIDMLCQLTELED